MIRLHSQLPALGVERAGEGSELTGTERTAQKLNQSAGSDGKILRTDDLDHILGHAPPVIQRLALPFFLVCFPVDLPGSAENFLNNLLVEFSPVPDGHCQIDQLAGIHAVEAELPGGFPGRDHIPVGQILYAAASHGSFDFFPAFLGVPFQINDGAGIDHLGTQSEGVDAGRCSVDGVVGHVTQRSGGGHGSGDSAQKEFGFVHPAVVGADMVVREILGTV